METNPQEPKVRLNLAHIAEVSGLDGDLALMVRTGLSQTTLWRLRTGRGLPSGRTLARLVLAFPDARVADFFVIEDL